MKKVIIISVLFWQVVRKISVVNGVGGAAGNVISSVADGVGL